MFNFQGTSPHFHRGAVCSAVQGQLASRLGHRPHTQGMLVGMSSSSGACRLCSPPWVHKHITPRRICPVVFSKNFTRLATRHLWLIFQILTVNHCSGSKNPMWSLLAVFAYTQTPYHRSLKLSRAVCSLLPPTQSAYLNTSYVILLVCFVSVIRCISYQDTRYLVLSSRFISAAHSYAY